MAERVLHGPTLDDKLWVPGDLVDDRPGPALARAPEQPGRPAGLRLSPARRGVPMPPDIALHDPAARARLLHAFANHELQAIELMALALLRFPDAPPAFRRGLVAALGEEQAHLSAYVGRMRELGAELGDHDPSAFFWRVMSAMPDPRDFVAHLSLTFEQANLDFARHYAGALRAVADDRTAAILDRVYEEEIGHVKLGLVWFRRWSPTGPSLLAAHAEALREPMNLRRARGIGFDREGRRRAGLPDDYIEELACFSASRGRAPVVHVFDPTAELSLSRHGGHTPDAAMRAMISDLSLVAAFVAAPDDVVLVPRAPSLAFVRRLLDANVAIPQLCEADPFAGPIASAAVPHAVLGGVAPWGWTDAARRRYASLLSRVPGGETPPSATDRARASKATWVGLRAEIQAELSEPWLDDASTLGIVARDLPSVLAAARRFADAGYPITVVKAIFGSAGRGAQRIRHGESDPQRARWIEHTLETQGEVVVEPWLDRVCDVSLRITVDREGHGRIDDFGRFLTDAQGQYVGAVLGPVTRAVPADVARLLHGDGRDRDRVHRVTSVVAVRTAALLHALGHTGPASIDALVYRDPEGRLRLRPVVEVNARTSFGHVATALGRHVAPGSAGVWLVAPREALPERDFEAWLDALERMHPLRLHARSGRIVDGVLPTSDPALVQRFGSALLVGPSLAAIEARLQATAPRLHARIGRLA
jgi:uncharacterized ferritin-like protein (DUF455 family)